MTYFKEEMLKKVIAWRMCSLSITLAATYIYTGSIKEASFFTLFLHATLIISHYLFESWWDRRG